MTILVIDSDRDFRNGLASILREEGHTVLEHGGTDELPPIQRLNRVDLVITDYDLPGEDGFQFSDRFQRAHPEVPVIIVTALSTDYLELQAGQRKHLSLVRKPVDFAALQKLIEQVSTDPGSGI